MMVSIRRTGIVFWDVGPWRSGSALLQLHFFLHLKRVKGRHHLFRVNDLRWEAPSPGRPYAGRAFFFSLSRFLSLSLSLSLSLWLARGTATEQHRLFRVNDVRWEARRTISLVTSMLQRSPSLLSPLF